jgi:hypothetical protein
MTKIILRKIMKKFLYFFLFLTFNFSLSSQPLSGIYTVGTGGNYQTLTNALSSGAAEWYKRIGNI